MPSRLGGDEFALTLPYADAAGAARVASRITEDFARATVDLGMPATPSVGVCATDSTPQQALALAADKALYRSKEQGRNCIQTWTGPLPEAVEPHRALVDAG